MKNLPIITNFNKFKKLDSDISLLSNKVDINSKYKSTICKVTNIFDISIICFVTNISKLTIKFYVNDKGNYIDFEFPIKFIKKIEEYKHIHLISVDADKYNFLDFEEENGKENGIYWSNGQANGKNAQEFLVGDKVYIYFHDSKNTTNKIILSAIVSETDFGCDEYSFSDYVKKELENNRENLSLEKIEEYTLDSKRNIKGFKLKNFRVINDEDKDKFKFIHSNESDAKAGICGVKISQTKLYLDEIYNNEYLKKYENKLNNLTKEEQKDYENILNKINLGKVLESTIFTNKSLKTLKEQYNFDVCKICRKSEIEKNTFLKPNGLLYYEIHHILERNFNTKISKLTNDEIKEKYSWYDKKYFQNNENNLIYNSYNEVKLCSKHHKELHYGKIERRKEILDTLVDKKYKEGLHNIVKNESNENEIIRYIYEQYDLKFDKN